jgi:ribose 5-phosphate isomerase B
VELPDYQNNLGGRVQRKEGTIILGSDHAGFELKEFIKARLTAKGIPFHDVGTNSRASVDYPEYGVLVARAVSGGEYSRGILICGTGIGVSIIANRFRGVRAALCCTPEMARLSREHNDSNILALGGRLLDEPAAALILDTWLSTEFAGGRHEKRVKCIDDLSC